MNYRHLLFLFLLFCSLSACGQSSNPAIAPTAISPTDYLDTFFNYASTHALGRETIDWVKLRREVDQKCAEAKMAADTHDAIHAALQQINKHSFLIRPKVARVYYPDADEEEADAEKEDVATPDVLMTSGRRIDASISYLSMPSFGYPPAMVTFADSLQRLIALLDSPVTNGWILDLRTNTGGNCWPMLAGIGPLLGEGVCGYFIEPTGENGVPWSYEDGMSFMGGGGQLSISEGLEPYELLHPKPRIAVLTGERTMSSGEVMAVAFRGKSNARSFGQPTGGYSTTNTNFNMPDGAIVILTVSVYADRNKQVFGERIGPDVLVTESDKEGEDLALAKAIEWLKGER